jgi:hypothetical protein
MVSVEKYDGEFTSMLGAVGLEEVGEFDELPIINKEQGYSKGYRLKRYGGAVAISKPLRTLLIDLSDCDDFNILFDPFCDDTFISDTLDNDFNISFCAFCGLLKIPPVSFLIKSGTLFFNCKPCSI